MLAMRRAAVLRPALSRNCAFLTKMKAMEAETSKLSATLPDGLKEIADSGVRALPVATLRKKSCSDAVHHGGSPVCPGACACSHLASAAARLAQAQIHADLNKFATERPELFKAVLAKIAEVRTRARVPAPPLPRRMRATR